MAEGVENVRSRACTRVCTYVIIVLTKTIQPFRWFQRFYKAVAHTQYIANVVSQHEVLFVRKVFAVAFFRYHLAMNSLALGHSPTPFRASLGLASVS